MGKRKVISPEARKLKGLEKGLRMFSTLLNNCDGFESKLQNSEDKSELSTVNITYEGRKMTGVCNKDLGEVHISYNDSFVTSRLLFNLNPCTIGEVAKNIKKYN